LFTSFYLNFRSQALDVMSSRFVPRSQRRTSADADDARRFVSTDPAIASSSSSSSSPPPTTPMISNDARSTTTAITTTSQQQQSQQQQSLKTPSAYIVTHDPTHHFHPQLHPSPQSSSSSSASLGGKHHHHRQQQQQQQQQNHVSSSTSKRTTSSSASSESSRIRHVDSFEVTTARRLMRKDHRLLMHNIPARKRQFLVFLCSTACAVQLRCWSAFSALAVASAATADDGVAQQQLACILHVFFFDSKFLFDALFTLAFCD
jgi:hypothetical protein